MKKLFAFLITLFLVFSGTEAFAMTYGEARFLDLTEKSGYTAEELSKGLKGELSLYAEDFITAERKYGVNAVFLAAVSALESGWGKTCFRENNIFGWSGKSFSSKSACIDFVASKIKQNYLSESGKYHYGKTVSAVNVCYNGNLFWEEKVLEIMVLIFEKAGKPCLPEENSPCGITVLTHS
ncbi:MAG: glucosaminidase domain-containing protein [Oscillospiraceae bacterium]|nr:glucosaminidase domain-containing protein [Oscillospiraceae bacterium]